MTNLLKLLLVCSGTSSTTPATDIEIDVKPSDKLSTIRFEISEGSLSGTAYIQSMGYMYSSVKGNTITYRSGYDELSTRLVVHVEGTKVTAAEFSHYISNSKNLPMECEYQEPKSP